MFDFPSPPTANQIVAAPNGAQFQWDGTKWGNYPLPTQMAPANAPVFTGDARAVTPAPGDADTSIATTAFVAASTATALHDVGRNLLHNPLMAIAQRGTGVFNTNAGYTVDRWKLDFSLDTVTSNQGQYNDGNRTAIGDEAANYYLAVAVTGNAGATAFTLLSQPIEDVRRLAGKTITVSFWANVAAGSWKVGIGMRQSFGSGGSPSAVVDVPATAITLTTTQARYSVTIAMPSIAGKTLGTTVGTDFTRMGLYLSAGANTNAQAGGIGVQSGTFVIWGVQLELGPTATPLEKPDPELQLRQCQRFYCTGLAAASSSAAGAGQGAYSGVTLPVTMRAAPTIAFSAPTFSNSNTTSTSAIVASAFIFLTNAVGAGIFSTQTNWSASADL
jgi:hypothetical protein